MKHKLLFLLFVVSVTMALCLSVSAMSGEGTSNDPYIVETAEDFVSIQNKLSAHYRLEADISVSSTTGAMVEGAFTGVFDGNGHTINVSITGAKDGTNTYDSLFGIVKNGTVKNLTVTGTVTGSDKVAGVVGKLEGSGVIDNCVNYATITGRKNIGGIVGLYISTSALVTNCVNYGSINASSPVSNGVDMGGIVGCVWSSANSTVSITNCYNAGDVTGNGFNCGGICGYFYAGTIENCFNSGAVASNTHPASAGSIFGKTENGFNHNINGYFSLSSSTLIGTTGGTVTFKDCMLESTGVAIYLGKGSGIRGEFHVNEKVFDAFARVCGAESTEYGAVVSTKLIVEELGGNLLSKDAIDSGKIVFAPAMKIGEKQYSYNDAAKGEGYHSFRFALTDFPDTSVAYNTEFVILGYILLTDKDGESELFTINTVISERLASAVGETGFNAVSIVRVAEATLQDGDFNGNVEALERLNHILSFKSYENTIEIDGITDYRHQNATVKSSVSSDDTVVFKISGTDNAEFVAYIYSLIENGYEKVFENVINGNLFYTFKNGETLINAVFTTNDNKSTITKETVTALPQHTSAPSFEKVTEPSITQIKLEASIPEGMSYVIQLSDGTFIIVDGGWCDEDNKEADKLYNTLVSLAGERDIVIAGWIFTHCHGDHIGTFNLFVEKYHDKVTINQLLYNFPADSDIASSASSYMLNDTKQRYLYFRSVIASYLPSTEFVKLHSGYKFYYADAEIEILQTLEDLYPSTVADYDFNSSSTVFTVKLGGQKMLFVGDISDVGATKLNDTFGSALKSDFVQVAHHGLNNTGVIKTMYINADAKYVLYPAPLSWFESHKGSGANYYLVTESKTVKQVLVSGIDTRTMSLPYDGTAFDGTKIPGYQTAAPAPTDRVEVARPNSTVTVPDAYFDLDLSGNAPTDSMGNASVTVTGGAITDTTVTHGDKEQSTPSFTGDRYKGNYYLTLDFEDITTDSEMGEFVLGSSTFEIFLRLDKLPGRTVGLITSCNGGGVTLYLRKQAGGQINFQIGSTYPNENSDGGAGKGNYSAVAPMQGEAPLAVANDLLHIVGSYDKATNMMKLYINGILVAEADFGEGSFKGGSGDDTVIGIGYNPQYSSEEISSFVNYELFEAKIYNVALTDEQVAQEYWNCIDNIFEAEAENE